MDETESFGSDAITLFVGILTDHFETMDVSDELDVRLVVEEYFSSKSLDEVTEDLASRVKLVAESVYSMALNHVRAAAAGAPN